MLSSNLSFRNPRGANGNLIGPEEQKVWDGANSASFDRASLHVGDERGDQNMEAQSNDTIESDVAVEEE